MNAKISDALRKTLEHTTGATVAANRVLAACVHKGLVEPAQLEGEAMEEACAAWAAETEQVG